MSDSKEKTEFLEKIEIQKEMLLTMPKNSKKNIKEYLKTGIFHFIDKK